VDRGGVRDQPVDSAHDEVARKAVALHRRLCNTGTRGAFFRRNAGR
jgi:hypothetical protein